MTGLEIDRHDETLATAIAAYETALDRGWAIADLRPLSDDLLRLIAAQNGIDLEITGRKR